MHYERISFVNCTSAFNDGCAMYLTTPCRNGQRVDRRQQSSWLQDETSQYIHSDLHNFKPSEETYLFFGKRGSGKTTVRLAMLRAYKQTNEDLAAAGKPEHFVIDLCSPGHMTACLKDFQVLLPLPLGAPAISHQRVPKLTVASPHAGSHWQFKRQLGRKLLREVELRRHGGLHHVLCHHTDRKSPD